MKNGEGKRRKNGEGKSVVGQTDVSVFLDYLPRYHVTDLELRFLFRAPEVPVLRVRKSHFYCFSSLQKSHFRCPKQKSETCSDISSVTWLVIWLWKLKISIFVCLFVYFFVCTSRFANFARGKWSNHNFKNCSVIRAVTPF